MILLQLDKNKIRSSQGIKRLIISRMNKSRESLNKNDENFKKLFEWKQVLDFIFFIATARLFLSLVSRMERFRQER